MSDTSTAACLTWLPQNPNVPHADREQCILPNGHTEPHESRTDERRGLYAKYEVKRLRDEQGKHDDCRYFVLDPEHDVIAASALWHYQQYAKKLGYQALADDLADWLSGTEGASDATS